MLFVRTKLEEDIAVAPGYPNAFSIIALEERVSPAAADVDAEEAVEGVSVSIILEAAAAVAEVKAESTAGIEKGIDIDIDIDIAGGIDEESAANDEAEPRAEGAKPLCWALYSCEAISAYSCC